MPDPDRRPNGARTWTLYDTSEDYTPRWAVQAEDAPPALEYAEMVVVVPVSEYHALREAATAVREAFMAHDYPSCSPSLGAAMVRMMEVLDA